MPTLTVLPNDPLRAYQAKGEIKERYFNPGSVFDRIEVISLTDKEARVEDVQAMAGEAELKIHTLGRPKPWQLLKFAASVDDFIGGLRPDVIRAYNPLLMGYLAVRAGQKNGCPSVISVHDDYGLIRNLRLYGPQYLLSARGGYQLWHSLAWQKQMFSGVTEVICAYPFAARWIAPRYPGKARVILNRVYLDRFWPKEDYRVRGRIRLLNLGRQFPGKNPANIIRALKGLDVELTLIGHGPLHARLKRLAASSGLQDRVNFRPSVPNSELPALMVEHDLFVMNLRQPGVCIPILEAMACGLPVVTNKPLFKDGLDLVGNMVNLVEDTPEGYRQAIIELVADEQLRAAQGRANTKFIRNSDGKAMEQKEADLYRALVK